MLVPFAELSKLTNLFLRVTFSLNCINMLINQVPVRFMLVQEADVKMGLNLHGF